MLKKKVVRFFRFHEAGATRAAHHLRQSTMVQPKITFMLADFQSGGTEWFVLRLARGLVRHGLSPTLLVARPHGSLRPLAEKEFDVVSLSGTGYTFFRLLKILPEVVRYLKNQKPDILFGGLTLLNIIGALAIKMSGVPTRLILVEHMRLDEPETKLYPKAKHFIKQFLVRTVYVWADKIVAVSEIAKSDLVRLAGLPASRVDVISNPIIPDDFERLVAQKPEHPWLCKGSVRPRMVPVIVAVGRLLPNKDFATLFHAFAALIKTRDARLLLFGEGEERPPLEKLAEQLGISSNLSFAGQTDNIFGALVAADLFVLSSRRESFGNVLVEALACGTPVVSTDSGGPQEILEGGRFGFLVPTESPALLAQAMARALDEKPDRAALQKRGRSFDVETATQAYLNLIFEDKESAE
jgi:glycosyltransferase involved in cell wall biosynthesis